jgi:hypothetical protein
MEPWIGVRLAFVAAALVWGCLDGLLISSLGQVALDSVIIGFLGAVVVVPVVVGGQALNSRSTPVWRYPLWSVNPFLLGEPLQFFHLAAYFFIAAGAGAVCRSLVVGEGLRLAHFLLPLIGAGVLLGVAACTVLYRRKMAHRQP